MERKFRYRLCRWSILMDLSRTFDYVLHDILLAKLAAYGVEESFLCYTYS